MTANWLYFLIRAQRKTHSALNPESPQHNACINVSVCVSRSSRKKWEVQLRIISNSANLCFCSFVSPFLVFFFFPSSSTGLYTYDRKTGSMGNECVSPALGISHNTSTIHISNSSPAAGSQHRLEHSNSTTCFKALVELSRKQERECSSLCMCALEHCPPGIPVPVRGYYPSPRPHLLPPPALWPPRSLGTCQTSTETTLPTQAPAPSLTHLSSLSSSLSLALFHNSLSSDPQGNAWIWRRLTK